MVYSDVLNAGLILESKAKYTMRDVKNVQVSSLFTGKTLSLEEAIFVVKCSAVYHNTDYTGSLNKALDKLNKYVIG